MRITMTSYRRSLSARIEFHFAQLCNYCVPRLIKSPSVTKSAVSGYHDLLRDRRKFKDRPSITKSQGWIDSPILSETTFSFLSLRMFVSVLHVSSSMGIETLLEIIW